MKKPLPVSSRGSAAPCLEEIHGPESTQDFVLYSGAVAFDRVPLIGCGRRIAAAKMEGGRLVWRHMSRSASRLPPTPAACSGSGDVVVSPRAGMLHGPYW